MSCGFLRTIDFGVTQDSAFLVGLAGSASSPQGEKNEEAYSSRHSDRRACHSGFGPDFRGLLRGSRYDHPYMLGRDRNEARNENDGKIQISEGGREGDGWHEKVPCLVGFKSA